MHLHGARLCQIQKPVDPKVCLLFAPPRVGTLLLRLPFFTGVARLLQMPVTYLGTQSLTNLPSRFRSQPFFTGFCRYEQVVAPLSLDYIFLKEGAAH
jgi:hypothetical protein